MANLSFMVTIGGAAKSATLLSLAAVFGLVGPTNACLSRMGGSETVTPESRVVSKGCEARWYSDPTDNPACFQLQKRLSEAARDGDLASVKELIQAGANVNGTAAPYFSPLNLASASGHNEIVELLVADGADTNRVEGIGNTALKSAVYFEHEKVVGTLLAHGADVCNNREMSALDYARTTGNEKILKLLIQAGAETCSPSR